MNDNKRKLAAIVFTDIVGFTKLTADDQRQEVKFYCITSHGLPETDLSQVTAKLEPEGFQWNLKNAIGVAVSVIGLLFIFK